MTISLVTILRGNMNREVFKEELQSADKKINEDFIQNVVQNAIDLNAKDDKLGASRNLIIAIEEYAEVTKEVTKQLRGKGDYYGLLEELADAYLNTFYIQKICGIDNEDLAQAINVKINRVKNVLSETSKYK